MQVVPFKIRRVQTDNGKEFEGEFDRFLKKNGIVHFYNYPKSPRSNAYVERLNRTLEEHYVNWYEEELINVNSFNIALMKYFLWYNTTKPHRSLGRLPPLQYFLNGWVKNKLQSKMLWNSAKI